MSRSPRSAGNTVGAGHGASSVRSTPESSDWGLEPESSEARGAGLPAASDEVSAVEGDAVLSPVDVASSAEGGAELVLESPAGASRTTGSDGDTGDAGEKELAGLTSTAPVAPSSFALALDGASAGKSLGLVQADAPSVPPWAQEAVRSISTLTQTRS